MTIGASRMYRGLDDFLSSDMYDILLFPSSLCSLPENSHSSSHVHYKGSRRIADSWTRGTAVPTPLDGITVNVHTHTLTSQAIRPNLGSDMDRQLQEKPQELV